MATENKIPYRPNDQIDFSSLKKITNRKFNEDNIRYIYNKLSNSYLSKDQISTILAAIISESGGDPLIKGSGTSKGLLQWYDDRYKISSDNPKTELDNQISFILNSLTNIKDNKSWTHGGKGSGYNKSTDAFNEFFNKESDLEHLNKSLNLAFIRPKGKHNSVQNRLNIARKIGSIIGIGNDFNEIAVSALKKVNNNPTNFIKRLEDVNRKTIKDWEDPTKVATHKMSWAQDDQSALIYPNVQEVDNRLVDYTKIPYREEAAIDSAYDNKDFIRMSEEEAKWFTENYKNYFPTFNEYKNGGKMSIHIKPENRGKFNATKKRTGKTTEELTHSKNPLTRKRAIFAQNAKKWKHTNGGELLGLDYYTNKLAMGGILDSPMVTRQIDTPVLKADAPNPQMTLKEQPINSSDGSFNIDPSQTVSNVSTLFSGPNIVSQGMNQQAGVDEGDNYDPNYIDVSKVKKDFNTGQTLTSNIGVGSSIGATIGSIIPGAGTLVGGAIGAVGGAIVGGIKSIFGNKKAKRQERRAKEKARGLNTMTTMESYMGKAYGFADGGNLSNVMGRKYFADGGLTTFNNGGSHEESPIGGIPQGTDDNGNVNLVEEGETRFQDYIFSDRLTLDEDMVKELNLPSKLIDKTFAEASEILAKDIEEHPNDPISKRGFEEMMVRLQAANNMKKDIEDSNTFAKGGELNIEGNETKTLSNEEVEKQVESTSTKDLIKGGKATEEIKKEAPGLFNPLEISIGVKVEMEHSVNPTFAREIALDHLTEDPQYYTKLYNAGLVDEELSEEELQYIAQNSQSEQPSPEEQLVNQPTEENVLNEPNEALNQEIPMESQQFAGGGPLEEGYARNNPFGTALYRKGWAHPFRRQPVATTQEAVPLDSTWRYGMPNILGESYILDDADVVAPRVNKTSKHSTNSGPLKEGYVRDSHTPIYRIKSTKSPLLRDALYKRFPYLLRGLKPKDPTVMDPDVVNQVSETPYSMWFRERFTPRDLYDLELGVTPNVYERNLYDDLGIVNPNRTAETIISNNEDPYAESETATSPNTKFAVKQAYKGISRKAGFNPNQLKTDIESNIIANENEASFDPQFASYELTPEELAILSPEDYQAYKKHERAMKLQGLGSLLQYAPVLGNLIGAASVGRAERVDPTYITPEQLNDYLQYNPIDPNTYTNPILGQAANTRRVMADLSGGSRASMLAGNLGINAQTQKAISDAALQAEAINEQRRVQAAEFNRGTNQFNASERARAKQYNASAKTMTDDINARNRAARRTAIRGYLSGALQGLGSIGREQANRNIIKTMGLDYYLDALARVKYKE